MTEDEVPVPAAGCRGLMFGVVAVGRRWAVGPDTELARRASASGDGGA